MIAIDTNVLVRLLVVDDQEQSESAEQFLATLTPQNPGLICREVLIELVWVLERTYGFKRTPISNAIHELITSSEIVVEDVDRVRMVTSEYRSSTADFSDLMIRSIAITLGASHVTTFDKSFAKVTDVQLLS